MEESAAQLAKARVEFHKVAVLVDQLSLNANQILKST